AAAGRRAALAEADMGADMRSQPMGLMRVFLSSANLSGANRAGANLARGDLSGANLANANLTGANMLGADLSGANLEGAILRSIRGREAMKGLETAKNVDKAIFD